MSLITLRQIQLHFGEQPLLDNVDLTIEAGERLCLVGRNGSGKSTFMRLLSDEMKPDTGTIVRAPGARVARLPQEIPHDVTGSVHDVVIENNEASSGVVAAGKLSTRATKTVVVEPSSTEATLDFADVLIFGLHAHQ